MAVHVRHTDAVNSGRAIGARKRILGVLGSTLVALAAVGCAGNSSSGNNTQAGPGAANQTKPIESINVVTGTMGGAFYIQGAALVDVLQRSGVVKLATAEATGASVENIRLVSDGKATFGLSAASWMGSAVKGEKPFDKKYDIVNVAPVQMGEVFFVTRADSPIKSISDLKGKKVVVGGKGSGMESHAKLILGGLDISFSDFKPVYLEFAEGATALREKSVDAQLQCCLPNSSFTELSQLASIKLIPYSDAELKKLAVAVPYYTAIPFKQGSFRGLDKDYQIVGTASMLFTSSKVDNEVVYRVTKTVIEKANELSEKDPHYKRMIDMFEEAKKDRKVLEVGGVPLHPGAERAYKEAGIIK